MMGSPDCSFVFLGAHTASKDKIDNVRCHWSLPLHFAPRRNQGGNRSPWIVATASTLSSCRAALRR